MCSIYVHTTYTLHVQYMSINHAHTVYEHSAQLHLELTRGDVADDLYAAAVVQARPYKYGHICAHTMYTVYVQYMCIDHVLGDV